MFGWRSRAPAWTMAPMLRFVDAANLLSLAGLASALAGALLAIHGRLAHGLVAMIASGLCDLFDGLVARRLSRTDEQRAFGGHLDSVVDACAFGFAPAIWLHAAGLRSLPECALLAFFAACAVWRLAYFDTVGLATEGGARYYTGVPVTYAALVVPLAALAGFAGAETLRWTLVGACGALAVAMVSPFRVRKPGGVMYVVLLLAAIGMIATYVILAHRYLAPPGGGK